MTTNENNEERKLLSEPAKVYILCILCLTLATIGSFIAGEMMWFNILAGLLMVTMTLSAIAVVIWFLINHIKFFLVVALGPIALVAIIVLFKMLQMMNS